MRCGWRFAVPMGVERVAAPTMGVNFWCVFCQIKQTDWRRRPYAEDKCMAVQAGC